MCTLVTERVSTCHLQIIKLAFLVISGNQTAVIALGALLSAAVLVIIVLVAVISFCIFWYASVLYKFPVLNLHVVAMGTDVDVAVVSGARTATSRVQFQSESPDTQPLVTSGEIL